jgi:hypothetical protein
LIWNAWNGALTQAMRTIAGFTPGTDKLDFIVDAMAANYADNLTPAADLAAYIAARSTEP